MRRRAVASVGAWVLALAGCAADPGPDPPRYPECFPGGTELCLCAPGRAGTFTCNAAGTGFSPCVCEPPGPRCGDDVCAPSETCAACPADCGVCAYGRCTEAADCGPSVPCHPYADHRPFCAARCRANADCPAAPAGSPAATPTCDPIPGVCYLRCTGPGTCPVGFECFRLTSGSFGYCS